MVSPVFRNELIERVLLALENHWLDSSPEALKAIGLLAAEPGGLELLGRLLIDHASDPDLYIETVSDSDQMGALHHAGHRVVRCEKCGRRRVGLVWAHQPAPSGWIVAEAFCPDCSPNPPKPLPEVRTRIPAVAVDQVVALIDAGYWDWNDEGYLAALSTLDQAALALIGEMWRLLAIEGEPEDATGLCSPLHSLFDAAIVYSRHGADPEIAARFRDLVDESLHQNQLASRGIELPEELTTV